MKFVQNHLTKHHLLHAPHRWFLAFLSSPIHFLEMHYKKRYHIKFAHARKLFLFDVLLCVSTLLLIGGVIFWWTYDPTVTDLVYISIRSSEQRMLSGDQITYTISYVNDSDVALVSPLLSVQLPDGFVWEYATPAEQFNTDTHAFTLNTLEPKQSGSVSVTGQLFATPHTEEPLTVSFTYRQAHRNKQEKKTSPLITIMRGSVLESKFIMPEKLANNSTVPFSLTIQNTGDIAITNVRAPLTLGTEMRLQTEIRAQKGVVENEVWHIDELRPNESASLQGTIAVNTQTKTKNITVSVTPSVMIQEHDIPQQTITHTAAVYHPHVSARATWPDKTYARPNETVPLNLLLTNDGDSALNNIRIETVVPASTVNASSFKRLNNAHCLEQLCTVDIELEHGVLNKGDTLSTTIQVPIAYMPQGGTDLTLTLDMTIHARIPDMADVSCKNSTQSPPLAIGTQMTLNAELRYYMNEGDQLGRGPLPPQVGKETKYWALATIQNSTSDATDARFTATLPAYVTWTNQSSVTYGSHVVYHEGTRIVSWSVSRLPAHTTVGIYFQLGLTPDETQRGTTPVMLKNIAISGTDSYINEPLEQAYGNLDISLPKDDIGRGKGVTIP